MKERGAVADGAKEGAVAHAPAKRPGILRERRNACVRWAQAPTGRGAAALFDILKE
jgi:hypothetical protein